MQPNSSVVGVNYTDFLAVEDGNDRVSRNVGRELPLHDA
jgi:hypothetical protein